MATQVVNLLHYRSLNLGQVPANLEFGQFAVNTYNGINPTIPTLREIYLFVGTGGDDRVDEQGNDLSTNAAAAAALSGESLVSQKGWVRYNLRSVKNSGDSVTGDLIVSGARLRFDTGTTGTAEFVLPSETVAVTPTLAGSIRFNTTTSKIEAWDGAAWVRPDTYIDFQTATASPTTRSTGGTLVSGDQWYNSTGPSLYFWDGSAWISFNSLV